MPKKSKKKSKVKEQDNEEDELIAPGDAAALQSSTNENTASGGHQGNDEDEEMDEDEDEELAQTAGISKNKAQENDEEKHKMKLLVSHFNSEQMSRYEAFRRANVNRSSVKKLANAVLNQSITGNVAVALSSSSKVFVGEIMERAREVQQRMDPPGPDEVDQARAIKPEHLREAWRLFKMENGTVPQGHWRRMGGEGDGAMFR